MRAQAAGAFAGVALDRTVVQLPGYVVDVYRGWGPAEHTFDYPLCFRGTLDRLAGVTADERKPMATLTPGYMHIVAAGPETVDGPWKGVWERAENRVDVTVLPAAQPTQAWVGNVPGDRQQAVLRRAGRDVRFVCVVDPFLTTDAIEDATELPVDGPIPALAVKIARADGGTDLVVVRFDPMEGGRPAGPTACADLRTRALVTVLRRDAAGGFVTRVDVGEGGD
jgi:hypothetical protein